MLKPSYFIRRKYKEKTQDTVNSAELLCPAQHNPRETSGAIDV
jgi:hypothetical protein